MNTESHRIQTKYINRDNVIISIACIFPILALPFYRLTNQLFVVPSSLVAHMISIGLLVYAVRRYRVDFKTYMAGSRYFLIILGAWFVYLIVNSIFGYYPLHSLYRLFSRFLMGILPAFFLGYFLINGKVKILFYRFLFFSLSAICLLVILEGTMLHEIMLNIRIEYLHILPSYANQAMWFQVNPNDAGFFIAILFLMVSMGILDLKSRYYLVWIFAVPVTALALHFINSRNAYIGFLIVLIYISVNLTVRLLKKVSAYRKRILAAVAMVIIVMVVIPLIVQVFLPERLAMSIFKIKGLVRNIFESDFNTSVLYNELMKIDKNRPRIWIETVNIFKEHIFTGVGYGAFSKVNPLGEGCWNAHNFILDILVEQGIVGLILYISHVVIILKKIKEKYISLTIILFPLMLLFDDLTWSYSMAIIYFFLYGIYFSKLYSGETVNSMDLKSPVQDL